MCWTRVEEPCLTSYCGTCSSFQVLGEGTSTSVTRDDLGWSVESLVSTALTVSDDGLTAVATGSASRNGGGKHDGGSKYGGVTGVVR